MISREVILRYVTWIAFEEIPYEPSALVITMSQYPCDAAGIVNVTITDDVESIYTLEAEIFEYPDLCNTTVGIIWRFDA